MREQQLAECDEFGLLALAEVVLLFLPDKRRPSVAPT